MKRLLLAMLCLVLSLQNYAQQTATYTNPILAGFYPDPSICKSPSGYYIVNSSFAYFPGLPIFHSKDLVNWQQIGNAMNRPEQLNLTGAGVSRGLFAPAISYHKGIYYIVCTLIDKGGNFVITATDPAGPWSNPHWLKNVDGIDPSLFFDVNDKAFILYNSNPPDNKTLWDGHRTIRMRAFDYGKMQASEKESIIINGGTDTSKHPVWIEGPHIYKVKDWYYLLCAEGGTGGNHSEVVFRSKDVEGPYISYKNNPILTQRHLNPNRLNPITTTGHADLIETDNGKWYAVFLGCRPYEDDHYNIGRETFMAPVTWENDWPIITKGNELVKYRYPLPDQKLTARSTDRYSGNFVFKDDFTSSILKHRYIFLRTVVDNWYSLKDKPGFLTLKLRPEQITGNQNPSFVAHRQQHLKCTATTTLQFQTKAENEKAGLTIFQNERHFYYLCQSIKDGSPVVQLFRSTAGDSMQLISSAKLPKLGSALRLRIHADGARYNFSFSNNGLNWTVLEDNVDGKFLSTKTAGGFVGAVFGMYVTSLGKESDQKAYFDSFEYSGDDEVLKK